MHTCKWDLPLACEKKKSRDIERESVCVLANRRIDSRPRMTAIDSVAWHGICFDAAACGIKKKEKETDVRRIVGWRPHMR